MKKRTCKLMHINKTMPELINGKRDWPIRLSPQAIQDIIVTMAVERNPYKLAIRYGICRQQVFDIAKGTAFISTASPSSALLTAHS
jgi:hypothetical protein